MGGCSAINCSNSHKKGKKLFKFPKDPIRRKRWLINCRRDDWIPGSGASLCEDHFEESQFELRRADKWKKLKQTAIPTIFYVPNPPKPLSKMHNPFLESVSTYGANEVVSQKPTSESESNEIRNQSTENNKVGPANVEDLMQRIKSLQKQNSMLKKEIEEKETRLSFLSEEQILFSRKRNNSNSKWSHGSIIKNSKKIPEDDLGSESSLDSQLESNLTPIELVAKVEPTTFITPDDVYPPDLSASGPSNRLETDSFQMEQSIHQAMTCEFYPADVSPPDSLIKIKEEPIDPNAYKQDTLSANVRQKLTQLSKEASLTSNSGIYDQNILSENVRQELIQFSKEASVTSNQEGSLFQPPVLIKEELISSEDEL